MINFDDVFVGDHIIDECNRTFVNHYNGLIVKFFNPNNKVCCFFASCKYQNKVYITIHVGNQQLITKNTRGQYAKFLNFKTKSTLNKIISDDKILNKRKFNNKCYNILDLKNDNNLQYVHSVIEKHKDVFDDESKFDLESYWFIFLNRICNVYKDLFCDVQSEKELNVVII